MAIKKVKNGKSPNYNCEAFQIISDGIKSALEMSEYTSETLSNNALPKILANKAFGVLISEKIITKQGKPNSESRYTYITGVLPFLGNRSSKYWKRIQKLLQTDFVFIRSEKMKNPWRFFYIKTKILSGFLEWKGNGSRVNFKSLKSSENSLKKMKKIPDCLRLSV